MRASTLFALTLAILVGLGTAAAIKVSGIFNKPADPVVAKKPDIMVLVAARNIFAGDMIDTTWVTTRALRPEEVDLYEKNKDQYLPSLAMAAALRIAAKNIEADKPIRRDLLQEMQKPESLSARLLPQMRAINISATKDHSAGGLIQVGEWVDVLLTSNVDSGENTPVSTRTACIAHKLRVITKRNGLWPVFAALPEDKPVTFTVEANPYRAAFIEFAKSKGTLSMVAVSAAEQKALEDRRNKAMDHLIAVSYAPFSMESSMEYQDEDNRVASIVRGDLSLGQGDLMRVFGLKTTEPPTLPIPPAPPITVQQFSGSYRLAPAQFKEDGTPADPPNRGLLAAQKAAAAAGYALPNIRFQPPCSSCEKKKQQNGG